MNKFVKDIYLKYLTNEISFDEVKNNLAQFFTELYIHQEFDRMIVTHNSEFLDIFIELTNWFKRDKVFLSYFHELLTQSWHCRHEIIIDSIRSYKSASSVKFITKALEMKVDYLVESETDYNSFVRKCMWTLAEIKSTQSIDQLNKYSSSDNKVLALNAHEQIRWLSGEKDVRFMG